MKDLGSELIAWYRQNKRPLPWRETKGPYKIWLSEIILQQTRVQQGTNYYIRFIEQFPDIHTLAAAPQDKVYKMWQGLGYYNRAANLMAAAKTISNEYGGKFPENPAELMKIKGIGSLTLPFQWSMEMFSGCCQEFLELVHPSIRQVQKRCLKTLRNR